VISADEQETSERDFEEEQDGLDDEWLKWARLRAQVIGEIRRWAGAAGGAAVLGCQQSEAREMQKSCLGFRLLFLPNAVVLERPRSQRGL